MSKRKTIDFVIHCGHIDYDENGKPMLETARQWKKVLRVPIEKYDVFKEAFTAEWNGKCRQEVLKSLWSIALTPYQRKKADKYMSESNFLTQAGFREL